jgi:hypothetical protein
LFVSCFLVFGFAPFWSKSFEVMKIIEHVDGEEKNDGLHVIDEVL